MRHFAELRLLLAAAALVSAGCGAGGAAYRGHAPSRLTLVGGTSLPDASHGGQPFAFRAAPAHALVVYFGYASCPDACPTTLSDLARAVRTLGPDAPRVDVAFVTVDLYRDAPNVLAPYLAGYFPNGHALVPAGQEALAAAEVAFNATSSTVKHTDGAVEVSHTSSTYLVDRAGHVVIEWPFGTKPADFAHDLREFLARPEASAAAPGGEATPTAEAALFADLGGGVRVAGAWARATAPTARMGAVYLELASAAPDTLLDVRVSAAVAGRAEMHETTHGAAGEMGMRRVPSVALFPGRAFAFAPGGAHVMLVDLSRPLVVGETLGVTLRLARAGERTLAVPVRAP